MTDEVGLALIFPRKHNNAHTVYEHKVFVIIRTRKVELEKRRVKKPFQNKETISKRPMLEKARTKESVPGA